MTTDTDTERAKAFMQRLRTRRERLNLASAEAAAMAGVGGRQFRRERREGSSIIQGIKFKDGEQLTERAA